MEIIGYYTQEACFSGAPAYFDSSVSKVVIEDEKGNVQLLDQPYFPTISPLRLREITCSSPQFPQNLEEVRSIALLKPRITSSLQTLPWDSGEMKGFLKEAERKGQIIWLSDGEGNPDYSYLYSYIQSEVDGTSGNVYILVGHDHPIAQQVEFLNELISSGTDGLLVQGVTHIALEAFNRGDVKRADIANVLGQRATWPELYLHDTQCFIDYYLRTGDAKVLDFFRGFMQDRFKYPSKELFDAYEKLLITAQYLGYSVVANSFSKYRLESNLRNFTESEALRAAVREKLTVDWVGERLLPWTRNVVFYFWGSSHTEKMALPAWIRRSDPEAKVITIVLNGGAFDEGWVFDLALRDLGWENRSFVLKLDGFREADLVVHLPDEGRVSKYRYSILQYPLVPFIE